MENFETANHHQNHNSTETPAAAISGADLLDHVAAYIRKYLVCDEHQLTILTLWSACSHSQARFTTAPYLDIRSPQPHCGKSVCIMLLEHVSGSQGYFTGAPAATLLKRLLADHSMAKREMPEPSTFLFDDCQHTFSSSERQPLLSLLNSSSQWCGYFLAADGNYSCFGLKAFAGSAPLPPSLAARCIPILLRRAKPSEKYLRSRSPEVVDAGEALAEQLSQWTKNIEFRLAQAIDNEAPNFSEALSPGQQSMANPLLYVADIAGGSWPAKARAAVTAVFAVAEASPELQILKDIRDIFDDKKNPEYLATSDLLNELSNMDHRPWSAWGPKSGKRLARHLLPFEIQPTYMHRGIEGQGFRGYFLKDFQDAWERYLSSISPVAMNRLENFAQPDAARFGTKKVSETVSETANSAVGAD